MSSGSGSARPSPATVVPGRSRPGQTARSWRSRASIVSSSGSAGCGDRVGGLGLDEHDARPGVAEGLGEVARAAADVDDGAVEQRSGAREPVQRVEGHRPVEEVGVVLLLAGTRAAGRRSAPALTRAARSAGRPAVVVRRRPRRTVDGTSSRRRAEQPRRDHPGQPAALRRGDRGRSVPAAGVATAPAPASRRRPRRAAERRRRQTSTRSSATATQASVLARPKCVGPLDVVGPAVLALPVDDVERREPEQRGGTEREEDAQRRSPPARARAAGRTMTATAGPGDRHGGHGGDGRRARATAPCAGATATTSAGSRAGSSAAAVDARATTSRRRRRCTRGRRRARAGSQQGEVDGAAGAPR